MNSTGVSQLRTEFVQFAGRMGVSIEELENKHHTLDSKADEPAEKYLPDLVEATAVMCGKTDKMMRTTALGDGTVPVDRIDGKAGFPCSESNRLGVVWPQFR